MTLRIGHRVRRVGTYVGHRARTRRMMLGMSQTELAAALGMTFQQIQKYERGIEPISTNTL